MLLLVLMATGDSAQQPATLTGRITDAETGAPLRGVSITAVPDQAVARTDANGAFAVPMPSPRIGLLQLTVSKPGYVRERVQAAALASGRIDLRMRRGAVLVAYVVDEQGRPVAGANVSVLCGSSSGSKQTDDRGEARVSGLSPGKCTVRSLRGRAVVRVGPNITAAEMLRASELVREQLIELSRQRVQQLQQQQPAGLEVELYAGRETVVAVGEMSANPAVEILPLPPVGVPVPRGTAVIEGLVTLASGQPAADVLVQISGPIGNNAALTTADGRFRFAALPAGRFQLGVAPAVQLTGLIPAALPRIVELADGQALTVNLGVTRTAAITGTVVDEFGDPAEDVPIRIYRVRTLPGAAAAPVSVGPSPRTDDRGRYRITASPGIYHVAALISAVGQREEPLYFPGTVRADDAVGVDVLAELETGGVDIVTARAAGVALRAAVVNAAGRLVERGVVVLTERRGTTRLPTRTQVPIVNGAFEIPSLRPGEYDVIISAPPGPFMVLTHRNGALVESFVPPPTELAELSVTIDDTPQQLVVQTGPPSVLRGRIEFEGDAAGLVPQSFRFAPTTVRGASVQPASVADDWTFRMDGLISTTRIGLISAPSGWWLRSFVVNGVDAASEPVNFSGGRASSNNVRAVMARTSRLSGRVTDGTSGIARGIVAAFAVEGDRRYRGSPFVRTTALDADGRYALSVPPGTYFVVAVPRPGGSAPAPVAISPLSLAEVVSLGSALALDEAMMLRLEASSVVVQVNQVEATRDLVLSPAP